MKIHNSYHEKQGWIPISKQKPPIGITVKLCHVHFSDWNLEFMEWDTEGWMLESGTFSLKREKLSKQSELCHDNSIPTHWKNIT